MTALPDFDALALSEPMMFEKSKPVPASHSAFGSGERFAGRAAPRAGDALRALEWSDLTARLNAARDLRIPTPGFGF